ncbi:MAG: hypothetical protein R6V74_00880, partial [Lutibacter sp.]
AGRRTAGRSCPMRGTRETGPRWARPSVRTSGVPRLLDLAPAVLPDYLQKINSDFVTNQNNSLGYELSVKTLFDKFPTVEIGFKQNIVNYISSNQTTKFITNEPYLTIDYDFLKGFIFSFDYENYSYQNKNFNQKNTYQLANATLSYKNEDSAWSFKIDAQNLFNVKYKNDNSFSSYIISDSKTYILPRIIMFSIGYNL